MKNVSFKSAILLALIQFILIVPYSEAQTVRFGADGKGENYYSSKMNPMGYCNGDYYSTFTNDLGKVFLEKVNKNLNLLWSKKILKISPQSYSYGIIYKNKIHLFYGEFNNSKSTFEVKCQVYNLEGEELEIKTIGEVSYKGALNYGEVEFLAEKSADDSQVAILVQVTVDKYMKSQATIFSIEMSDLGNVNQHLIEQKHPTEQSTQIRDLVISNSGHVYGILRHYWNSSKNNDWILSVNEEGEKNVKPLEFKENSFWYSSMALDETKDEINIAGLYVSKTADEDNRYQGFYFAKYDAETLEIKSLDSRPIDAELMTFLDARFKTNKSEVQFTGFYYPQVFPANNGGGFIIFEHDNAYVASDLIIFNYDEEGKLNERWMLPKYNTGSQANGYFASVANESLNIIYNDNDKNRLSKDMSGASPAFKPVHKKTITLLTEIEAGTAPRKKVLFNVGEKGGFFVINKAIKVDQDIFFQIADDKKHRYGIIKM